MNASYYGPQVAHRTRTAPPLGAVLFLGLILALIAVAAGTHATQRHGQEAALVRQCVSDHFSLVYRDNQFPGKYYLVCELPDHRWGLQIVAKAGQLLDEITSFIPGDGSYSQVTNYVLKFATRFKGDL